MKRRVMPSVMVPKDFVGVSPMRGPIAAIHELRAAYDGPTGTREWVLERIHEYETDSDVMQELIPRLCDELTQEELLSLLSYCHATIAIHNRSDAIASIAIKP